MQPQCFTSSSTQPLRSSKKKWVVLTVHAAHIIAVAEVISTVTKEIPPSSTHRQPLVWSRCPCINKKPHLHTVGWWVHSGHYPKDSTFITAKWVSIWIPRLLRQIELVCYLRYNPSIFSEILIQDLQIVLDRDCARYQFVCQCHTVLSRIKLTIIFNTNYQNKAADSLSPLKAKKLYSIHIIHFNIFNSSICTDVSRQLLQSSHTRSDYSLRLWIKILHWLCLI